MKKEPKKTAIDLQEAIRLIEEKYGKEPLFTEKAKHIKKRMENVQIAV